MQNGFDDFDLGPQSDEYEADYSYEEPWDGFRDDVEADADALASAGFGTDEDYGYGGEDSYLDSFYEDRYDIGDIDY
jgi:hypothetical protein